MWPNTSSFVSRNIISITFECDFCAGILWSRYFCCDMLAIHIFVIMPYGSLITSISTHLKIMQDTAWIRAASYGKVNRVTRTLWNQDDSCAPGWAHITITPTRFLSQNTKQLRHVKGNDFHFLVILRPLDSFVAGVTHPLKHLTNNYCPFSFFSYIFDRSLSFCISPITKQQIDDTIPKRGT